MVLDITEEVRIDADLCCADCGYNLLTQPLNGRCPECGLPVVESVQFEAEYRFRAEQRKTQAKFLLSVSLLFWFFGCALLFMIGVSGNYFHDNHATARAAGALLVISAAGSGTMLITALILGFNATLHGDYANVRRYCIAAAANPVTAVAFVLIVLRMLTL